MTAIIAILLFLILISTEGGRAALSGFIGLCVVLGMLVAVP